MRPFAFQQIRKASNSSRIAGDTTGKYTPNIFSPETPMDRSFSHVPKNPFWEAWVFRRDNIQREFVWTWQTIFDLATFVGGLYVAMYATASFCSRQNDKRNGYPERNYYFSDSKSNFVIPDEREFY
eukprot:CAMPEP_0175078734 /NCGR_PEP_ID=MMETSP0052_2-20121109/24333_1 /TAXON_ID=51329 ORGANISM="Polytomella parva, Strain SAG 63-3" /NCGR_SAMPLE_ID=MMETSP0052_2 /ASSEMBLY_ACC=CAM_ASM_000194 /LENGTH=125 /DNA_ID=CAMNT_0016348789 /DNA_START=50 /DNA_END=427 /DNA_ORIENTATION=-